MYKSFRKFALNYLQSRINRSDIEMITVHTMVNYTSLKDLMPESPPSTASPTCCRGGDGWREIPIKDPLLQHAAWAYLQPMLAEHQSDDRRRWWRRCSDKLCWLLSCFNGVVFVMFGGWFPVKLRERMMIKI